MRWAVANDIPNQGNGHAGPGAFGQISPFNFSDYPALQSWLTENRDLLDQYDATVHNPERAIEICASKGYAMGGDGLYASHYETLQGDMFIKPEEPTSPRVPVAAV